MKVIKFQSQHYRDLSFKDPTRYLTAVEEVGFMKMASDESYSVVDENDRAIAVYGVEKYHENRGEVWLVSQTKAPKESLAVFRFLKKAIENCTISRLECIVRFDNASGHKLATSLGFQPEAVRMKKFFSNGSDGTLYSYVKE